MAIAKRGPELVDNWISKTIVQRFDFKTRRGKIVKEASFQGHQLTPQGVVAKLKCAPENCRHHFQVVEHLPFDILLGKQFSH